MKFNFLILITMAVNLTTSASKGQNMQNAYNPTHLITTYQSILNSPLKSQIENEYSSYPLPQFDFPINFSVTFDFPNPDIPGHLSSILDHIISILDAKPSLNILSITIFAYSNEDYINTSINIMLKPNQSIDLDTSQSIANNISYNWDNPIQINTIPNNNILILNMHEQYYSLTGRA